MAPPTEPPSHNTRVTNEQAAFWSNIANKYDRVVDLQIGRKTRSMVRERVACEEGFRHSAVLGMGLLERYRGRGLGSALLRAVLAEARSRDLSRIELEVYTSNQPAIALYERVGFRREGIKRSARILDGEVKDILCMALLTPAA